MLRETSDAISLVPKPGFVIKTLVISDGDKYATKVFINLCQDDNVPQPEPFDPQTTFQKIIDNSWEIPLILSNEKSDTDKKGNPSLVYDCIINPGCFNWVVLNSHLKSIMIEWCLEAVELLYLVVLERKYVLPKLRYKGAVVPTVVPKNDIDDTGFQKKLVELKKNDVLGLIEQIKSDDETDEQQELPDLLNIGGIKKPLIQEIDENEARGSEIEEIGATKPKIVEIEKTNQKQKMPETGKKLHGTVSGDEKLTNRDSSAGITELGSTSNPGLKNIKFSITYDKLDRQYQLLIKFTSKNTELTSSDLELRYTDDHLTLSSNKYTFINKHSLDIPIAKDIIIGKVKSFLVTTENSLYIFV